MNEEYIVPHFEELAGNEPSFRAGRAVDDRQVSAGHILNQRFVALFADRGMLARRL
jgi:hypothetical protein